MRTEVDETRRGDNGWEGGTREGRGSKVRRWMKEGGKEGK